MTVELVRELSHLTILRSMSFVSQFQNWQLFYDFVLSHAKQKLHTWRQS